jgi:hypothetical protein
MKALVGKEEERGWKEVDLGQRRRAERQREGDTERGEEGSEEETEAGRVDRRERRKFGWAALLGILRFQ